MVKEENKILKAVNSNFKKLGMDTVSNPENSKIQKLREVIEEKKSLVEDRNNLEKLTERQIKTMLKNVVGYLNLQRDIVPILNTYSASFYRINENLKNGFVEQLKEEDYFSPSESSKISENLEKQKRQILNNYSSDIEIVNKLSMELKTSSDFIIRRYEELELGKIERDPDVVTGIKQFDDVDRKNPPPGFLDRSEKQLDNFEKQKKPMDPMDIAKYYKDMIFNILS